MLAGAAALALGYCGLVGVSLPGLEAPPPAAAEQNGGSSEAVQANGKAHTSSSSSSEAEPPLLRVLFGLCGSKDGRAVLRAVTALGYIGAGSSSEATKLAIAKGELICCCASVTLCASVLVEVEGGKGLLRVAELCGAALSSCCHPQAVA